MKDGPVIVSIIVAIGFTMAINVMMFMKIDFSAVGGQAFLILIGALGNSFTVVVTYWFVGPKTSTTPTDKP
jgi:hypothetical protein